MYLHIFNFKWTHYSCKHWLFFVKMTLYCLNPNRVVLQSIITLIANASSIKILLHYFLDLLSSSGPFLWSNPSSICFSFNPNTPSLSIIVSMPFVSCFSAYINPSWLIYESIKNLSRKIKIRNSLLSNLFFPNSTILPCLIFIFLKIHSDFLIPPVIAQIFIHTAELIIPSGTQTNQAYAEIWTNKIKQVK